jgi:hypothetical protein
MIRVVAAALACVCALAVACSDDASTEQVTRTAAASANGLSLTLSPENPRAGEAIRLGLAGPPGRDVTYGADVRLERLDGERWMLSHRLVSTGGDGGQSFPAGQDATIPAIGLSGYQEFGFTLPEIEAGTYRLTREVAVAEGSPLVDTLAVEFVISD